MEDYQAMAVLFFQEQAEMRLKLEAIAAKQLQMDKELEDKIHYLQDQQRDIEFSKQKHAADLQQKNRLSRLLEHKISFQERIVRRREADLRKEREERINQLVSSRKRVRGTLRKLMYYLNMEEQRIQMFRKEDEAWERERAEHMKRMAAERQLMLDAIAARQLQREMEIE